MARRSSARFDDCACKLPEMARTFISAVYASPLIGAVRVDERPVLKQEDRARLPTSSRAPGAPLRRTAMFLLKRNRFHVLRILALQGALLTACGGGGDKPADHAGDLDGGAQD